MKKTTEFDGNSEKLWCVHLSLFFIDDGFHSSEHESFFTLAPNKKTAIAKANEQIEEARIRIVGRNTECFTGDKISAVIVDLEKLVPCRNRSKEGSAIYSGNYVPAELCHGEDKKRYRLAVCLVPVEN